MRSASIRFILALAFLSVGSGVLTLGPAMNLPQAVAEPPVGAATQTVRPQQAQPENVSAIRLARPPNARIVKALGELTEMEFVDAPIQDVVDYLKDLHGIEIQLDAKALEEATIGPCTPMTCNLKGISLCSALEQLLHRWELTYAADGEMLRITSQRSAARRVAVRLYDCAWVKQDRLANLIEVVGLIDTGRPTEVAHQAEADRPAQSAPGFKVVAYGTWLAVRANEIEHEAVRQLLVELRDADESAKR